MISDHDITLAMKDACYAVEFRGVKAWAFLRDPTHTPYTEEQARRVVRTCLYFNSPIDNVVTSIMLENLVKKLETIEERLALLEINNYR